MSSLPTDCLAVMGPTATGKSSLAVRLAREFDGEVVSMDSRQVYRGFDIGTGKVTRSEMGGVDHHLLDVLDPTEAASAGAHARMARHAIAGIVSRGRLPVLAGGTGLYFRALLGGLIDVEVPAELRERLRREFATRSDDDLYGELGDKDPNRAAELSPRDRVRVTRALELIAATGGPISRLYRETPAREEFRAFRVVLTMPRPALRARVEERTRALFDAGWVDEVRELLGSGVAPDAPAMIGIGYREIAAAVTSGEEKGLFERVVTATQQYGKRQETFFRADRDALRVDVSAPGWYPRIEASARAFLNAE